MADEGENENESEEEMEIDFLTLKIEDFSKNRSEK